MSAARGLGEHRWSARLRGLVAGYVRACTVPDAARASSLAGAREAVFAPPARPAGERREELARTR